MDFLHDTLIRNALFALCLLAMAPLGNATTMANTMEKERPLLNEETKRRIANCRRDPSPENLQALREQIERNYDKVVARKMAKLEELRHTARHESLIREMEGIVAEMQQNRGIRVEQSIRRFTDPRLRPGSRQNIDGFLPVLGARANVSISYTPVTNGEYAQYIKATRKKAPDHWGRDQGLRYLANHPVCHISYEDALAYCQWRTLQDGKATYRLPTAEEWELAAGHMPKDADFNCGTGNGTTQVDAYASTLSACGAIDMWGNCWEWTATPQGDGAPGRQKGNRIVKGGSWASARTACRSENREYARPSTGRYPDVGFRIVREQ